MLVVIAKSIYKHQKFTRFSDGGGFYPCSYRIWRLLPVYMFTRRYISHFRYSCSLNHPLTEAVHKLPTGILQDILYNLEFRSCR